MTNGSSTTAQNLDAVSSILSALKLNQLLAIIMMSVVTILDIAFVAFYLLSKLVTGTLTTASMQVLTYPIIVGVVMTALTIMVYYWSTVIASGSYVSASASLMQVSMVGGQGAYPPVSGVTAGAVIGNNLTANDLTAINSLIAAGKLQPAILATLQTMTPTQIQSFITSLGGVVAKA